MSSFTFEASYNHPEMQGRYTVNIAPIRGSSGTTRSIGISRAATTNKGRITDPKKPTPPSGPKRKIWS